MTIRRADMWTGRARATSPLEESLAPNGRVPIHLSKRHRDVRMGTSLDFRASIPLVPPAGRANRGRSFDTPPRSAIMPP